MSFSVWVWTLCWTYLSFSVWVRHICLWCGHRAINLSFFSNKQQTRNMNSLETAKAKLEGHILFENLPKDRNAKLWDRIESDCHLTLDEVSALQNAVCSPQGNQGGNIHFSFIILIVH